MDYKNTLNLPKTDFPMEAKLTTTEPKIREKWEKEKLYEKIRKARKGAPKYILHDGPPYANGDVHVGTGQNKILKDMVVRYKTMQGFDSPYIPGWDCHGLPIEHKVTEKLGSKARETEKSEIRRLCREFAEKYIDIQRRQFKSLGVLGDWENPYRTIDHEYEVAIVEVFELLFNNGYVYKRNKPIHWCMRCRTALAEAELEYKNLPSHSIYVKFKIDQKTNLLIWTTTPWTLPANEATALHPDIEYATVQVDGEQYIVAKNLVEKLAGLFGWQNVKIISTKKGKEFEGVKYTHPLFDKKCPVVLANYVRLEDGTGCVHTAPGHGEEDYITGVNYKLPISSPVDEGGNYTKDAGKFVGKNVFKANDEICEELNKAGLLQRKEEISHDYPCCWRCKSAVIFRATEQWFILVDHKDGRKRVLDAIKKTRWVPKWGEIRISSMLAERPDWCISRQRSWGVPIPAFYCTECGELFLNAETLVAVKELFRKEGADSWFSKPAKEILPKNAKCKKCSCAEFRKESDIVDVWFESAASHRAVCMKRPDLADHFPPELYLEGTDQHRGWFQVSLLASILSQDKIPFKEVVTHGFLVDARTGDKLSKSGFLIPADEVVSKLGSDILRLWIASIDFTDDLPMSWEILSERKEPYKKIRNTFRYLLGNTNDYDHSKDAVTYEKMTEIDKWALAKLNILIRETTDAFEDFAFFRAYNKLYNFCVVDMSAIYFAILKDRLYTAGKNSPERRSAQTALYEILVALVKMHAPILSHTAEEIYSRIPGRKEESIALETWPKPNPKWDDEKSMQRWSKLFEVRDEVYKELEKLRNAKTIGSSLEATVEINIEDNSISQNALEELFIVSEVKCDASTKSVKAYKSPHPKCERCWNYKSSVGKNSKHPTICARCVSVIEQYS